jgi:hypothetical protein
MVCEGEEERSERRVGRKERIKRKVKIPSSKGE